MSLIYILDPMTLEKVDVIEEYESMVWTERFIEPGDCRIVLGATHANAVRLRPDTFLLHEDSDEPMFVETRDIKDGTITAVGKTYEAFFNGRYVGPLGRDGAAKNIIRYVVYNMQNRQDGRYAIYNLRPQDFEADTSMVNAEEHILGFEKGHDAVLRLAKKYSLGIAVRRMRTEDGTGWELVFVVRETTDRSQPGADYLRLSPKDDNFANIGELYSVADWTDVILVHAPKAFSKTPLDVAYGWWPMSYPEKIDQGGPNNFYLSETESNWRVVEITVDDIDQAYIDKRVEDYWAPERDFPPSWWAMTAAQWEEILRAEMTAKAKAEWHQRQVQQKVVFDGQVPGEILKFGVDYNLGDIVVVEGNFTGGRQTKLISEYIRSSDGTGARSYPTLSSVVIPYDSEDGSDGTIGGGTG